jgi:hypothetical protein
MTETELDPVRSFTAALPAHARQQLHMTQLLQGLIHAAIRDHGWTVPQLAKECGRDLGGVVNVGALITHRVRDAASRDAPAPPSRTGLRILPLCGSCENGLLLDPETHYPAARCPCRTTKETST